MHCIAEFMRLYKKYSTLPLVNRKTADHLPTIGLKLFNIIQNGQVEVARTNSRRHYGFSPFIYGAYAETAAHRESTAHQ